MNALKFLPSTVSLNYVPALTVLMNNSRQHRENVREERGPTVLLWKKESPIFTQELWAKWFSLIYSKGVYQDSLLGPELDRQLRDTETEAKAQLFGKLTVRLLGNHDAHVYKVCCGGSWIRVFLGKHMGVPIWGWECYLKVLHEKTLELDCEGSVAVTKRRKRRGRWPWTREKPE